MENILLLRHETRDFRLRRLLSVLKMRDNAHDHDVHEFAISDQGFRIGLRFQPDDESPGAAPPRSASDGR